MNIAIPYIIYVILIGLVIKSRGDSDSNRRMYIFFVMLFLVLMSAFRSLSVGSDTTNYYNYFRQSYNTSWPEVFANLIERFFHNNHEIVDPGFTLFQKIVQIFTKDYIVYGIVAALVLFVPMSILLYRNTDSISKLLFAFVLYGALFLGFTYTCSRQQLATGFAIVSFLHIQKGERIKPLFWIFLGVTLHNSCLLMLLLYALNFLSPKLIKTIHLVLFVLFPLVIVFSDQMIYLMGSMIDNERYMEYATGNSHMYAITFTLLVEVLSFLCYLGIKKEQLEDNYWLKVIYCAAPLFTILGPLITHNGTMIRISYYFLFNLLLLVPIAIDNLFFKNKNMAYAVVYTVLILYCCRAPQFPYYFFWQEPYQHYIGSVL